jgi:hypothetical protein
MCWSQQARVDHTCKKMRTAQRRKILKGRSLEHPQRAGEWSLVTGQPCPIVWQTVGWAPFFPIFLIFFNFFFGVMKNGLGILGNGCTALPFSEPCPYTWKGEIFHSSWRLDILFFPNFIFATIRIPQHLHIHQWDYSFMKKWNH